MKCILDGKQAAILVPTTVLAQQHYATAIDRFRAFPVTVRDTYYFLSVAYEAYTHDVFREITQKQP